MADDNSKKAQNSDIKNCVLDFFESTSFHGFLNIKKSKYLAIKLLWIILLLLSTSYCFYGIITFIIKFSEFEVIVNYQSVIDAESEFPSITICNLNPFDLVENKFTGDLIMDYLANNQVNPVIEVEDDQDASFILDRANKVLKASIVSNKKVQNLKELGFSFEKMLISCYYNKKRCTVRNFTHFRDFDFGNCYTFNSQYDNEGNKNNDSLKSFRPGSENGLVIELFVGILGSSDYYTQERGIIVAVHERGMLPLMKYHGIKVSVETFTGISVSRTKYSKLSYPYNSCKKDTSQMSSSDSIYYNKTFNVSTYFQTLCIQICLQYEYVIKICKCKDPSLSFYKIDDKIPWCDNFTTIDCITDLKNNFNEIMKYDKKCLDACPLECDSTVYSKEISSSRYPSKYYAGVLQNQNSFKQKFQVNNMFKPIKKNITKPRSLQKPLVSKLNHSNSSILNLTSQAISNSTISNTGTTTKTVKLACINDTEEECVEHIQNSILKLSVYYSDMIYTKIEESPAITIDTLVGVIGGLFGLFIGASFLSFVEVLEMVIDICIIFFKRIFKKYSNRIKSTKT